MIGGRNALVVLSGSMFSLWSASASAAVPNQPAKPCASSDLTVEVYATGGVIRPSLADSMFESPARTTTTGAAEQDFTARGGDIGFNNPWMPVVEGGAIVFPCRFFGIGIHGGGSWSGLPDGQAISPQLAQRSSQQLTMMRLSGSIHGQLPISRYFVLRATAMIGYRYYSLGVTGVGQREALLQQFSLEPRLEARLRLPVAVPFGVSAYVGGEVISQPALTVGGGLFLATDWPSPIRRASRPTSPTPPEVPLTPPPLLMSPFEPSQTPVPSETQAVPTQAPVVPTQAPVTPPVDAAPTQAPVTPPVDAAPTQAPVTPPAAPVEAAPVQPVAPTEAPPVEAAPVQPAAPTEAPPAAVVNGVAFMDLAASGTVNIQSDVLNVRSSPSRTGSIVGGLPKGSKVTITGVAPGWYRIRFKDSVAYVSADFIQRDP